MIHYSILLEQLINGLVLGSMYALVASGLTLIWGTMKMLNFAHGELFMLGGFGIYLSTVTFALPIWLAIPIVMICIFILAAVIEKAFISPLLKRPDWDVSAVVVTLGIGIFIQNFAFKIWGGDYRNVPYIMEGTLNFMGMRFAWHRIYILIMTVIVLVGFWQFMKRTRFGMAMRATSFDPQTAILMGIAPRRIFTITFGLSACLAALAGSALAPIFSVNPWMGVAPLIKGFIVVILGGLGSFSGAILGGFIIGLAEAFSVLFFPSGWKDIICFVLLIVILVIRPQGLLGKKEW